MDGEVQRYLEFMRIQESIWCYCLHSHLESMFHGDSYLGWYAINLIQSYYIHT